MTHDVQFLPLARLELLEARDWYDRRAPNLGDAFLDQVDRVVQRIAEHPLGYPIMLGDLRRARLRRFPYSLFFRVAEGDCFVLACFHAKRDPRHWRARAG